MTVEQHAAGAHALQAEDHPQQRRLAGAVGADQARELAWADGEADLLQHLTTGQPYADALDRQDLAAVGHQSFCVETFSASALCSARTSASIHD